MKRLLAFMAAATVAFGDIWMVNPYNFVVTGNYDEGFEGIGIPTNWIDLDSGPGASDWDYTTAPISGAQSLFLPDPSSGAAEVAYDFPEDADEIWAAFKYKVSADPASSTSDIVWFTSSVPADLARLRQATNGTITCLVDATASGTIIDLTPGSVYRFKLRYVKGTGSNEVLEVWIVADGSGSWGTSTSQTNGTSTARAGRLKFNGAATHNSDKTIDNVKVSTADIAITDLD
jgi:hypothetical protein